MLNKFTTKKPAKHLILFYFFICIAMCMLCFQYYRTLQNTIKAESSEYLQEVTKQISHNVNKTINDTFSVLLTISNVLKNSNVSNYAQMQEIVVEQKNFWNYNNILLIDEEGSAFDAYGKTVSLGNERYLQDALLSRKPSMSSTKMVEGNECIVFVVPVYGLQIEGKHISALAATYDLSTFDQVLSLNAFNGKAYAHIINKDGTIAVRSSSVNAVKTGYSFTNTFEKAVIAEGGSANKLKKDIAEGRAGFMSYEIDGNAKYMVYTPLTTKEWSLITIVPVADVSANSQILSRNTLILCGIITITFSLLIISLLRSSYLHRQKLEHIAYVDPLTGGHTIVKFTELANGQLKYNHKLCYAMIFTNVENFKILNEQFGRHACDKLLCSIYEGIAGTLGASECIGRVSADNFCILVEYENEEELLKRFNFWYANIVKLDTDSNFWLSPMLEFGVYVIYNKDTEISSMIDRAKIALIEVAGEISGRLRYSVYNEATGKKMLRDRQLEDKMEQALQNSEFKVFLQPKYIVNNEKIGGAEALVRWHSATEGMIFPNEFIPLFEKNGFIIQLDQYVFEEVCKTIRRWLDEGKEPVKVSVNCSRIQMKKQNFWEKYVHIAKKYNVPLKYLELELTESIVFEDVERLSGIINAIRQEGFGCSMDDFGSGYSSLNLIKDIPVDTIKLDKIFFKNSGDIKRTESVVGSITNMSKALNIYTVAEGVESVEHVQMLQRLQCDFIQGYYYAKPMPIVEFEALAFAEAAVSGIRS